MYARIFQPQQDRPQHGLLHDCVRLIRDLLAVANDLFHLQVLERMVDFLDTVLNENQPQPVL